MNIPELDETELTRSGFRPRWGRTTTTTTTADDEEPDVSISFEGVPARILRHVVVALMPQNVLEPVSPSVGGTLVFQSTPQKMIYMGAGGATSYGICNPVTSATLFSLFSQHAQLLRSITHHETEVLNWDAAIEVAPTRPSGTIAVTLEYTGRGIPMPVENPWE